MNAYNSLSALMCISIFTTLSITSCSQKDKATRVKSVIPKIVAFNPGTNVYQELLDADKDSVAFNSGFVTLLPGEAGDLHSTQSNEELIVAFSGAGKVKISNGDSLNIQFGSVAHIPANTEHQVVNTGSIPLKYIYITAKSE